MSAYAAAHANSKFRWLQGGFEPLIYRNHAACGGALLAAPRNQRYLQ